MKVRVLVEVNASVDPEETRNLKEDEAADVVGVATERKATL